MIKKRVAIITYTCSQNWGAMLQAHALFRYLEKLNVECKHISFRPFDKRKFKPRKYLGDIFYSAVSWKQNSIRVSRYDQFRKTHLNLTAEVYSNCDELTSLNDEFNYFISGSDQLWNCATEICHEFYLAFVKENSKKIAYAPSFGMDSVPDKFKEQVKSYIQQYKAVSVREQSGKKIISDLTGIEVAVLPDPVFLMDNNYWIKIAGQKIIKEPYIFVYITEPSKPIEYLVRKYAEELNVKVYSPYYIKGTKCVIRKDIGPIEFLNYVVNAEYIITNSFHATAFSVIFNKQFCVVPHSTTGARVVDLLTTLNLQDALVRDKNVFQRKIINYRENKLFSKQLSLLKNTATSYLTNALEL